MITNFKIYEGSMYCSECGEYMSPNEENKYMLDL